MKLTSVHVREYKSVIDSNRFEIGDVTCLVGKNEAGKTAVLEALNRLNPLVPTKVFDPTDDYPRAKVEEYLLDVEQKKRSPALAVEATFTLEPSEMVETKEEFGQDVFANASVLLSRGYEKALHVKVHVSEKSALHHLVQKAGLPPEIAAQATTRETFTDLQGFLTARANEQQAALTQAQAEAAAIADEQEKARALDDANKLAESQAAKQLRTKLAELQKEDFGIYVWHKYLEKFFPKFLYFDEYYQMEGQLNIQKLKTRQGNKALLDSDHPMLALIDLARLNLDQLVNPQNTQALINKLEGASNYLSGKIFQYWSQNKNLAIRFDIRNGLPGDPEGMREGTNLWGFVYDAAHQVTIRLGTRSRGFIWFFSFLAWFSQQRQKGHSLILLLDEPGLFLHASAQGDLLRYIDEELKPHHQVIYTTHSPFMIDPKHFERVRIVRDKSMELRKEDEPLPPDQEGTKILADVLDADEGSIFPLQGALAFDITQTFFVGPNSLIIEGVSDMFYIDTMTGVLAKNGRDGLSDHWTLSPVGGFDKVSSFVALFRNQKGLNIATLIDLQKKDQQKVENLYREKLLKKKQVLTYADFTRTGEADVEDMFEVSFYLDLVNSEYKAELAAPIKETALPTHPRILVRLQQYFEKNPLTSGKFNHYRPARYFAENIAALEAKLAPGTLGRFECTFELRTEAALGELLRNEQRVFPSYVLNVVVQGVHEGRTWNV